jgi:hypothetical protein
MPAVTGAATAAMKAMMSTSALWSARSYMDQNAPNDRWLRRR